MRLLRQHKHKLTLPALQVCLLYTVWQQQLHHPNQHTQQHCHHNQQQHGGIAVHTSLAAIVSFSLLTYRLLLVARTPETPPTRIWCECFLHAPTPSLPHTFRSNAFFLIVHFLQTLSSISHASAYWQVGRRDAVCASPCLSICFALRCPPALNSFFLVSFFFFRLSTFFFPWLLSALIDVMPLLYILCLVVRASCFVLRVFRMSVPHHLCACMPLVCRAVCGGNLTLAFS